MFAGVRGVLSDIRNHWSGGNRQKVERSRVSSFKKLDTDQRSKLARAVNTFVVASLTNLNSKPNFTTVTSLLGDPKEAEAAGLVFIDFANQTAPEQSKIADLARNFLRSAVNDGVINQDRSDQLYNQVLTRSDRGVGPEVAELFARNITFFKQVFALDESLGMKPNTGGELLHRQLQGTSKDGDNNREKAVVLVVNGLQRFRVICMQMIDAIKAEGAKRGPVKAPKNPTDNDKHPAATKPHSGGPSASMQPKVAATQAAATQAAGAAMSPGATATSNVGDQTVAAQPTASQQPAASPAAAGPAKPQAQTIDRETAEKIEATLHQASKLTPDQIKRLRGRIAGLPATFNGPNWQKGFQQITAGVRDGTIKV